MNNSDVKSINRKDRTIELADGRKVPLPDDLAFEFFGSEAAKEKKKGISEAVGSVQKGVENLPFGAEMGAFTSGATEGNPFVKLATNFLDYVPETIASISPGKGQEEMGFFSRLGENIEAVRSGRREGKQKIQQENPNSYLGGELAGVASSFVTPLPKVIQGSPVAQSIAIGQGMSDKSILNDPMGVLKDTAIDAGIGKAFGMVGNKLEKVAAERGALRKYPELLAQHAAAETQAQKKFISEMARKLDAMGAEIKGGIPKGSMMVDDFINSSINMSPIAGTPQASNLTKFFNAIGQSAPETMNIDELKKIFQSIEGRMALGVAEEIPILNQFRQHLVDNLPLGAASSAVKNKFGTRLINSFEKEIDKSVNAFLSDSKLVKSIESFAGKDTVKNLAQDLKKFVKSGYEKMTPAQFMEDMKSGNLQDRLMWYVENNNKLQQIEQKIESTLQQLQNIAPLAQLRSPEVQNLIRARDEIQRLKGSLQANISNSVSSNATSLSIYEQDVLNKVTSKLANAVGVQPTGNLRPATNMRPSPTATPQAPQVGRMAGFFEQPNFYSSNLKKLGNMRGGAGIAKLGYLAKGLPKMGVAGGAMAGAAGLTAALRGVTSPTALGAFAREGIQKGGMRFVVESISEKYPSYQNGVLSDPMDRRAASSEIEQDPDIGLEDKAILQARINRGQNIETLIKE
jgi:hypothetical protein